MHIDIVPNRGSTPTVLLRRSYREDGKTKKQTIANLSELSPEQIEQIRAVLRGDRLLPASGTWRFRMRRWRCSCASG